MHIDSASVADMRELAAGKDFSRMAGFSPSGFSIGAIVELACLHSACPPQLRIVMDKWAKSSPALREAFITYQKQNYPSRTNMWASRQLEFFPIAGPNWADGYHYHPFEFRFQKAAEEAGFGQKSKALCGALFEMADNVVQHSGSAPTSPAPGLIGYYVCDGHVAFAISDLGRGCLASLKENPRWSSLANSKAALLAVVEKHASRREYGGDGGGFKDVYRALANLDGLIELRSHDGRVKVSRTPEGRAATSQYTGFLPGFQLSVSCSLVGPPKEQIFSI